MATTTVEVSLLRRRRQTARLSQQALADACGCSRNTIVLLEGSTRRPRADLAQRLSDRLGVHIDDLFPLENTPPRGARMPEVTVDPVEFVRTGLENVPADPADATPDDLTLLGAIVQGAYRHCADVHARTLTLGRAAIEGDVTEDEARRELAWLMALSARSEIARELIASYLYSAHVASGVEGAWNAVGVTPPRTSPRGQNP